MSKKTNAAKQKRREHKPRKGARRNPAYRYPMSLFGDDAKKPVSLAADPILLQHIVGFILRMLELHPPGPGGMGDYPGDNFIAPEGITPKSEVN
jgi:hypothetical protein